MTNIEKIKAMNMRELAEFLKAVSDSAETITVCDEKCGDCDYSEEFCVDQIADWLTGEVEK